MSTRSRAASATAARSRRAFGDIRVTRIGSSGSGGFGGGIVNNGTISAAHTGVAVARTTSFSGGISNGGTISVGGLGIVLGTTSPGTGVASFVGNIANSGTIIAKTAIGIFRSSTINGAIVDSGTIRASSHGILVDSGSEILAAGNVAVDIVGRTFTGGISNSGVMSGSVGIEIVSASSVSIFDAGAIIGTGGTAIEFAGSGNTLTLGAGYLISGIVDPLSGSNTFQLGGTGSDTFDLSSIGATAQYRGFTTFNVVGGTWTVTGASTAHWNVNGGMMDVASGAASDQHDGER